MQDGDMHLSSSVLRYKMNEFQRNNAASVAIFNCLFHYCDKRYERTEQSNLLPEGLSYCSRYN